MIKEKILSFGLMLFVLTGCESTKVYSDHFAPIVTANVKEITIEIQESEVKSYSITERQEINDFIFDLENSEVNGPWKGAEWDKIVLHYEDGDEKVFRTNGKVFGQSSSGIFYDLNDKYKHYWEK